MNNMQIYDNCKACTESYSCPYFSMESLRDMERCQDAQLTYEYEKEVRAAMESGQPTWLCKYNIPVTTVQPVGISKKLFLVIVLLFIIAISACATLWFIPTLFGLIAALVVSLVLNKLMNGRWL